MLKWARSNFSFFYKAGRLLFCSLILIPVLSFAQTTDPPLPCDGDDPYGNCPLDTYVWLLAIIALVFGAIYLYRQQKQHSKA